MHYICKRYLMISHLVNPKELKGPALPAAEDLHRGYCVQNKGIILGAIVVHSIYLSDCDKHSHHPHLTTHHRD